MIIETLLDIFFSGILRMISLLPTNTFEIPSGIINGLTTLFNGVGYVLPIRALTPIVVISVAFIALKILWSTVMRVKSFIPTISGG